MELISLNTLIEVLNAYKNVIIWFGSISLFVFLFSLLSIKWLVALIPEDYFVTKRVSKIKSQNPLIWYLILILKLIQLALQTIDSLIGSFFFL